MQSLQSSRSASTPLLVPSGCFPASLSLLSYIWEEQESLLFFFQGSLCAQNITSFDVHIHTSEDFARKGERLIGDRKRFTFAQKTAVFCLLLKIPEVRPVKFNEPPGFTMSSPQQKHAHLPQGKWHGDETHADEDGSAGHLRATHRAQMPSTGGSTNLQTNVKHCVKFLKGQLLLVCKWIPFLVWCLSLSSFALALKF